MNPLHSRRTDVISIAGLGPHGERAAPPQRLAISETDSETARARRFSVAVVLHTTTSDWSKQLLAGIVTTFGQYSAAVVDVVDCEFEASAQIEALRRLSREHLDAVISIPIGNTSVADAHREVSSSGAKLILIDNAPSGLIPGRDYASVISADNFGLGQVAASLLSPHVPHAGCIGIVAYGIDFFATQEREIAFRKWMGSERPDVAMKQMKFANVDQVAAKVGAFLRDNSNVGALFAVWDVPAMQAVAALRSRGLDIPVVTVDLGNEAAIELAGEGLIKGIAAQQPYDLGTAVATAAILSLVGCQLPPWVALPGLPVTRDNVVEAYQVVWHSPSPPEVIRARRGLGNQGGKRRSTLSD